MRVIIVGLPLFAKQFKELLSKYDTKNTYIYCDTYYNRWHKLKFLLLLPFSSVVVSMNGVSDESGSMNWVLKWKKKLVIQWMGTDAQLAVERYKNGTAQLKYLNYATNFTDTTWLGEEMKSIDYPLQLVHFKELKTELKIADVYSEIRVVSYVPQSRQLFYGLKQIAELAKIHAQIPFDIYGMDQPDFDCPDNMNFHGWCSTEIMAQAMQRSPLFLRFTEHDGYSLAVLEALSYGAEVLWSYATEWTHQVDLNDPVQINDQFDKAIGIVQERGLKPHYATSEVILRKFEGQTIATNYIQKLKNLESKK